MKNQLSSPSVLHRSIKIIVAAVIVFLLVSAAASFGLPLIQKVVAQHEVERGMGQLKFSIIPAYSGTYGHCHQEPPFVKIGSRVYCDYIGEKFYKGKGHINADLQDLDRALRAAGWKLRRDWQNDVWEGALYPQIDFHAVTAYSVANYDYPAQPRLNTSLIYFTNTMNPAGWQNLEQRAKANIKLADDEYAYGVYVYTNYDY